ncbi:hypothetical protein HJB84_28450 [Rhizobium sp. NZLR1b]|uniref:hypothetical protein n=1 Tax=unclassified Rhizobium TaxID=2613769 RepID=UPI00160D4B5B|nr:MULTISPECIES: hypothetical protein [unclassified Rhizobium]MBB3525911.1 hypothetical protein [Rhizobium sp. BK456]MBX5173727.1 hypothetical protein [Rhizobium sp. NZLR1b]MBX5186825.1 hypothetical protein [Rhizobium sp. NZLR5]
MTHVTFIHGIGNKPKAKELHDIWLRSLATGAGGIDLGGEGVTSSMVYWADVLYADPDPNVAAYESFEATTAKEVEADATARTPIPATIDEATFISGLALKLGGTLAAAETVEAIPPNRELDGMPYERIPLPWPIKKAFMETFLRDVHHYLFNVEFTPRPGTTFKVQDEIRKRFVKAVAEGSKSGEPQIVVSHSMGTVIAYDCLKRVPGIQKIGGLMTIGSPLGLDEIQDKLRPEWSRPNGFPSERVEGGWVNVFDRLDPVAGFDPFLKNDYQRDGKGDIEDVAVLNEGAWRHSIVKYLRAPDLRRGVEKLLAL